MAEHAPDPLRTLADRLRRPLVGRRVGATLLFLLLLGGGLLWPLWASWQAQRADAQRDVGAPTPTAHAADRWWDAGPLDAAHAGIAGDCRACHSRLFTRVQDRDCRACHAATAGHVPALTGDEAHAAGEPRCASCHREHQGPQALALQNAAQSGPVCVDCHRDISAQHAASTLADVSDFASAHPEFAVRVAADTGGWQRLRLGDEVREATGLRFPHAVHVAAAGIDAPDGTRVMACADCHRPDAARIGFQPVRFERDCRSCHGLALEPGLPARQLPHGDVDGALAMIREFYAYATQAPGAGSPAPRQRPGHDAAAVATAVGRPGDAVSLARATATQLFEASACAVCHTVTREADYGAPGSPAADLPRWRIAPLAPHHRWMPAARFDHAAHANTDCTACHAAPTSTAAEEVLMPGIAVCRDCHVGAQPVAGKVTSDCGLCHGYHPDHAPGAVAALRDGGGTP